MKKQINTYVQEKMKIYAKKKLNFDVIKSVKGKMLRRF